MDALDSLLSMPHEDIERLMGEYAETLSFEDQCALRGKLGRLLVQANGTIARIQTMDRAVRHAQEKHIR